MSVRILSIDPGLTNYAWGSIFIPIHPNASWQDVSIEDVCTARITHEKSLSAVMNMLPKFLCHRFRNDIHDVILIEHPNISVKLIHSIAVATFMYFATNSSAKVFFVSPKLKLKYSVPRRDTLLYRKGCTPPRQFPKMNISYRKRKSFAVDVCMGYLRMTTVQAGITQYIRSQKKKDDIADALLQAFHFVSTLYTL